MNALAILLIFIGAVVISKLIMLFIMKKLHHHHHDHHGHHGHHGHHHPGSENMTPLSHVKSGTRCKILIVSCDTDLGHRLLEMGFVPNEEIGVVENSGGTIMVDVKGSKLVISEKIAHNINVEEIK